MRNLPLLDQYKPVVALNGTVPAGSTPRRISLRNAGGRVSILVAVQNGGAGVVGSAVTLHQSKDVAGTGEKTLALPAVHRVLDTGASDALARADVTSNTFTTDATVSKSLLYVIEVNANDLDVANGFDCIRVGTGNATAATVTAIYLIPQAHVSPTNQSAIAD